MKTRYFLLPIAALFGSNLIGCTAIATQTPSAIYPSNPETISVKLPSENSSEVSLTPQLPPSELEQKTEPKLLAYELEGEAKQHILQAIADQKDDLNLCLDEPELSAESLEFSDVYVHGDSETFLAKILCWNAAYQGVYEFVVVTPNLETQSLDFRHSNINLVGYPTFDSESNIIHNSYKFNGAGSCFEETRHYWDGYSLRLLSAELVDGVEFGCDDMGVRSPSEDFLITSTSVGNAKLGMTLAEFRAQMKSNMTLEPVILGVDIPDGLQLSWYGDVQYDLGFDSFPITEDSKINLIAIRNPSYKTIHGVGAGTPLTAAIAQHGPATLSYSTENELREAITFEDGLFADDSNTSIWIRSNQWTITDFAGIYPESDSSYHETRNYHDHAAISSIWLMQ
ncbi:hypothetical protein Lepto7376_2354 [[Leptolyngbya] sp. PCC 7376]|uniref:DUF1176 domain-containing protein n=1 Tax=[Leptolyngbya] sp. PCC 7376 TaxID=111781 RepID=UPI00029F0EBF|nr:DUF1176 domain-containing protein [[Leptolyngbya] sp. PCC 7376]AFY38638.1 hypothetical protein Lepto7376_2354 [[Leptolyngbya] sp. PCC 7376]